MGLPTGSIYTKVAALCLLVALLLHLISFASPSWAETNTNVVSRQDYYGLWRFCTSPVGGGSSCSDFIDYTTSDWLKCCQAFMTLSLFTMMGTLVVAALHSVAPGFDDPKVLMAGLAFGGITTLFMLIGISVFGDRYWEWFVNRDPTFGPDAGRLGWAFGLSACSLCLTFVATGLFVIEKLFGEEV